MNILILEPFFTGSHSRWAKDLQRYSHHTIQILSLPGRYWKWRMSGGALSLAKMYNETGVTPDLILASDMLDLAVFLGLTDIKKQGIPVAVYFHENQLTYPWSPSDQDISEKRDYHYVMKNFTTALAADTVLFNSHYHRNSFLDTLPGFLKQFPDYNELWTVETIAKKSSVLYLGLDLVRFDRFQPDNISTGSPPLLLWNHRWEYDKNPDDFFEVLMSLSQSYNFNLAILGENYTVTPPIFNKAKKMLNDKIVTFGYAKTFDEYASWLWKADICPVTNIQDFFGISIMEAAYCNTALLLPNRLTYPELFDLQKTRSVFYNDTDELTKKLQHLLKNTDSINRVQHRSFAEQFDWSHMIQTYDMLFENIKQIRPYH